MSTYRNAPLPQLTGRFMLSDGGLETSLIFLDGIDLPHFASFVLLDSEIGRAALTRYYENYLLVAAAAGLGFVLDTPTWRASPDWGARLGYSVADLNRVNADAVAFCHALRQKHEPAAAPIVVNGVIGPRGDGYQTTNVTPEMARAYHQVQINAFASAGCDMVSAITMTSVNEAIGIAEAAEAARLPAVISFTVETDGRLPDGTSIGDAIARTDEATGNSPRYYMINCAHPTHFAAELVAGAPWLDRISGIRANASTLSHAELDEATELDAGDPIDLGQRYRALMEVMPNLTVLGGCCGTDHRHIAAISAACADLTHNRARP